METNHPIYMSAKAGVIYSKPMMLLAIIVGGPLTAGYIIAHNFRVFEEKEKRALTWSFSIVNAAIIDSLTLFYVGGRQNEHDLYGFTWVIHLFIPG